MTDPSNLGYKDPEFLTFCNAWQKCHWPTSWKSLRDVTQLLGTLLRTFESFLRLPRYSIGVTNSETGDLIRRQFEGAHFDFSLASLCVATLVLPQTYDLYIRGRSRQALRTNIRKAEQMGVTCSSTRIVNDIHEAASWLTRDWVKSWAQSVQSHPPLRNMLAEADAYIAYNEKKEPIALSLLLVDTEVAFLFWSHATATPDENTCRYLLHGAIIDDLISRGVRSLIVDCVVRLPPGLQYLQARLGFVPAHIRFRDVRTRSKKHHYPT